MSIFHTGVYRAGNDIVYRLCTQEGVRKIVRERFKPELFLPAPYGTPVEVADALALRGENSPLEDTPLVKMQFDSMYDFTNYINENRDVPGVKMYGMADPVFQAITRSFPKEIEPAFEHVRVFNLDIEVVSSYMKDGKIIRGPFPEPYIEPEEFRMKKFDDEAYAAYITEYYKWWNLTFPTSAIPVWTNMNAAFPITSLQLSDRNLGKYILWNLPLPEHRGKYEYDPKDPMIPGLDVEIREFQTEQEMLMDFIKYWAARSPDFWTGWNIKGFDSPYLAERVLKILGEDWVKALSPVGRYRCSLHKPKKGVPFHTYDFTGCPAMPYDDMYRKHRLKERRAYSLDYISHVELKERKLSSAENKDMLTSWFTDPVFFNRYGLRDIWLVDRLDEQLGFIDLTIMLAAVYYCNYEDTLDTVRPWTALMFHHNFYGDRGRRVPLMKRALDNDVAYDGAFVHTPVPGRYRNVLSEDLNSLYPHIEQQYNMGPETKVTAAHRREIIFELVEELESMKVDFVKNKTRLALIHKIQNEQEIIEELVAWGPVSFETLKRHNVAMTPNLQFFHRDFISCYSSITRKLYSKRKVFKGAMLTAEQEEANLKAEGKTNTVEYQKISRLVSTKNTGQMGVKIVMNAGYGAIGNRWFKEYYDPEIARAITASGELINKWITHFITQDLRELSGSGTHRFVVYGDTDSIYLDLSPFEKSEGWTDLSDEEYCKTVDLFEREKIQPLISAHCEKMADMLNAYEQRMFWGREVICRQGGIFQAKKRYALLVNNSEGVQYPKPKLKITGLESKKSTTPEVCVPWLEEIYKLAIINDEEKIFERVKEYRATYFALPPEDISIASSVSAVNKYRTNPNSWETTKGAPYQATSALLHNRLIEEAHGSTPLIQDGDKILIASLKERNPWGKNNIAFQGFWPEEFGERVKQYVDYEGNFEKSFLQPSQLLLDAVKMTTKKKVNVLKFFKQKEA